MAAGAGARAARQADAFDDEPSSSTSGAASHPSAVTCSPFAREQERSAYPPRERYGNTEALRAAAQMPWCNGGARESQPLTLFPRLPRPQLGLLQHGG
eukprot:351028-Chlamydomonas_euryale.AAC.1